MNRIFSAISNYLAVWVVLGAALAYWKPEAFSWIGWTLLGWPLFKWMFAVTMFAVGTVIDGSSFQSLVRHPRPIVLGLLTQFTVMPTLAWITAKFGGFPDAIALGFIIVGCAPGAMTSNVLTYLARGDTAYSVTLTTIASILAVFITPALVWGLAGEELGMSADQFWSQLNTIAMTVAVPLILGLLLRRGTPNARKLYETVGPAVAALAIVVICCFVIEWTHEELGSASLPVFVGVVVINGLGFVLGWALGRLYGLDPARRITLSIEIGMQNAGMGVVLAASSFKDRAAVAIPAALFTIWCIVSAAVLIGVLKRRNAQLPAANSGPTHESEYTSQ